MGYIDYKMPYIDASFNYPPKEYLSDPDNYYWVHVDCVGTFGQVNRYCTYRVFDKRTGAPVTANGVNPTRGSGQPLAMDDDSNTISAGIIGIRPLGNAPQGSSTVWPPPLPNFGSIWVGGDMAVAKPSASATIDHFHEWREVHLFSSSVIECKHCGVLKPDEKA